MSEDSEDRDDLRSPGVRPYSLLIQSLNAKETSGQPLRKKRKLAGEDAQLLERDSIGYPAEELRKNGDLDRAEEADEDLDLADFTDAMKGEEELDDADCKSQRFCCHLRSPLRTLVSDPYDIHFGNPNEACLSEQIRELSEAGWQMHRTGHNSLKISTLTPPTSSRQRDLVNALCFTGPENLKVRTWLEDAPRHSAYVYWLQ